MNYYLENMAEWEKNGAFHYSHKKTGILIDTVVICRHYESADEFFEKTKPKLTLIYAIKWNKERRKVFEYLVNLGRYTK